MADKTISFIRTVVPVAWGALIRWLLSIAAWIPDPVVDALRAYDEPLTVVVIAAFYAAARWLEQKPWIPRWLVYAVLGSPSQPRYVGRHVATPANPAAGGTRADV